jgi:DNA-binding NarL/FixJ family response regulator
MTTNGYNKQRQSYADLLGQYYEEFASTEYVDENPGQGIFQIGTVNAWLENAKNTPIPKLLFDGLWVEGELAILFAATGIGKSVLAVQVGQSIASGVSIPGFAMDAGKKKVLYIDYELSGKQIEGRYACRGAEGFYTNHFRFSDNFFRAEVDSSRWDGSSSLEALEGEVTTAVNELGINVLIVDNLSALSSKTEKADEAVKVMQLLNKLKKNHQLSILVLAHTPKRDDTLPLGVNHLLGSSQLANLCDSMLAIGRASDSSGLDTDLRYIKQIKVRSGELKYGANSVQACKIVKHSNFLSYEFNGEKSEHEYLGQVTNEMHNTRREKIIELHNQGMTQKKIAERLMCSPATVNKYVKELRESESLDYEALESTTPLYSAAAGIH